MIKLKFDEKSDTIEMLRGNRPIASLTSEDFGSLIGEIKCMIGEVSPATARKQERKAERKNLIRQLKLLVTVKLINFLRWFKSYWKIINQ